jgi:hypothetical protein
VTAAALRVRLPALTVRQPHTWAIAYACKDVENRGRATYYRGPLAVHAGLTVDTPFLPAPTPLAAAQAELHLATKAQGPRPAEFWNAREEPMEGPRGMRPAGLACGAFVALTRVVGCHFHIDPARPCDFGQAPMCSPWAQPGQWHWELADTLALPEPIPAAGARGLWTVPTEAYDALWAAAAEWLRHWTVADPRH